MTADETEDILAHPGVMRVRGALREGGLADTVRALPSAVHTARAAADALACDVGEIAKSIIFRAADGRAVLVIASGRHRVDSRKVEAVIGQAVGKADAEFVRARTGFVIGGVAPIAHAEPSLVLLDEALLEYDCVRPAAGHPNTLFSIAPRDLARIAGARVADVALDEIPARS
jgi:prolyl-tRNA editing enzyme YbaK/EbsC (Cys-tRNA(Pro) deacylase)